MHVLAIILSIVLILVLAGSSIADFTHQARIVETMERLRLPKNFETIAGVVKVAAVIGLVVGLAVGPNRAQGGLTVLVAWCLVAYFALAAASHLRVKDPINEVVPAVGLAVVSLVLAVAA